MIYITGDTHGNIDFKKLTIFAEQHKELTKNDYMIIAGDFGGIWSPNTLEADLDNYSNLPFSILFADGNHENFDILDSYPVEQWNGGKIHRIRTDIFHLMRGQVFMLCNKTFFAFGGGSSFDKHRRKEGISWWKQEMPSYEELDEGIANLKKYNNKVDYIVTHSVDERALFYPLLRDQVGAMIPFRDNAMLSYFEENVEYGHWYFGHYHTDGEVNDKKTALYQQIIRLM